MLGRTLRLVGIALALGVLVGSGAHPVRAEADLGGYSLAAHAPALRLVLDSDAVPVPAHPVLDATIPETTSTLETGPLGHGLASLFWPGDLGGHAGSAVQQLNQLCTSTLPIAIPNLPPQCFPIPQQLKDQAPALNDPFKAETFLPGGPLDVDYFTPSIPGLSMASHATEKKIESVAGFAFGAPGLGDIGWIKSSSVVQRGDKGTASSKAVSELFDVGLVGGLVTIDHIASTASATTDGANAIGTGRTVVSGLSIGGVPAAIDDQGIHLGSISAVANNALRNLGLDIRVTTPVISTDGAKGSSVAPVLVVSYRDDQNALEKAGLALGQKLSTGALSQVTGMVPQLAVGPQATVTLSLGGATATADGSPALVEAPDTSPAVDTPGAETSSVSIDSGTPASDAVTAVEGTTFSAATRPAAASTRPRSAATSARPNGFLDGFGGLAWGLVLAAVLGGLAMSYGLYRFGVAADAADGSAVPKGCTDRPPR